MPIGRRTSQKMSKRGEISTARDIGGTPQPGSGNTKWAKGDVKSREMLVERKDTLAKQYTLHHSDLQRLLEQSIKEDRDPVFVVGFEGRGSYAVISWHDFLSLREGLKK